MMTSEINNHASIHKSDSRPILLTHHVLNVLIVHLMRMYLKKLDLTIA
jgi:hypothetical protein